MTDPDPLTEELAAIGNTPKHKDGLDAWDRIAAALREGIDLGDTVVGVFEAVEIDTSSVISAPTPALIAGRVAPVTMSVGHSDAVPLYRRHVAEEET